MTGAAKLGTLAEINAWLFDRQRLFVQATRNSIKLEPEAMAPQRL
jgi:hypothetical protein